MNILISSIIRNQLQNLVRWKNQINQLVKYLPLHSFHLSVYLNDSTDNTKLILKTLQFDCLHTITSLNIQTKYLDRFNTDMGNNDVLLNRLTNLANARNKTLEVLDRKDIFTHVLIILPDIIYNPLKIANFIRLSANHDIVSVVSLLNGILYDTWATRVHPTHNAYSGGLIMNSGVQKVYSTFNCICLYNSLPFYKYNLRFSAFNSKQLIDCDTVNICESFINKNYNRIAVNTDYMCILTK